MTECDENRSTYTGHVQNGNNSNGTKTDTGQHSSASRSSAEQARNHLARLGAKYFFKNGATLLHQCVDAPPAYVYVLANGGVPVNVQNNDGDTALHLAVRVGNYRVTQALLRCCADLASRNKLGQTPVDIANGSILDMLMRHQPGILQVTLQGKSQVLDRLCKSTWVSIGTIVKEEKNLLQVALTRAETDPNVTNCCRILHEYRDTSDLVHAVLSEDIEHLQILLSANKRCPLNMRYRDRLGDTLLAYAIECNNLEMARLLVACGSRVNNVRLREHDWCMTGSPLLHNALHKDEQLAIAKFLFSVQDVSERTEKDSGEDKPRCVGCDENLTIKHILLDCVDFSTQRAGFYSSSSLRHLFTQQGNTAILKAIENGRSVEVIQWLLEADEGRCLVHRNEAGQTAREIASLKGRSDVVSVIDRFIEQHDKKFQSFYLPVHFCGQTNTITLPQVNISYVNDKENLNFKGQNELEVMKLRKSAEARGISLFEAAAKGDLVEVERLSDASYQDTSGYTALTRAVAYNQSEVAKYLCISRPELKTIADNCNRYPLHYACALPDDQLIIMARILLERNPEEIDSRVDKDGRFPVDYKNLRGTEEIRAMLFDARTLDAYAQRGPPLGDMPDGAETSPPVKEE